MIRPETLERQPGMGTVLLGGLAATILLAALVLLALEYAFLDFPRLVGGIFTGDSTAAFHLGFWLIFAGGVLFFAPVLGLLWNWLPGEDVGLGGALVKGILWGASVWVLTGIVLPLLDALNALEGPLVSGVGFFALSRGPAGAGWLALGTLSHAVSVALVAGMTQGIKPLDTFGWEGYEPGENQNEGIY